MKRKFLSLLLALAVISAMIMAVPITGYAESTVTVYNFSDLGDTSYSNLQSTPASLFSGAISLYSTGNNAGESASLVSLSTAADITYDSNNTIKCTKILSGKSLCFDIKLNDGDKLTVYYCGCNNSLAAKALTMTIQYNNTTKQTETNAENSNLKPYTISYTADASGTYSVISDTTNRTGIYAVVVESTSTSSFGERDVVTGYYTTNNVEVSDTVSKQYVARFFQEYTGDSVTSYGFYVMDQNGTPTDSTTYNKMTQVGTTDSNTTAVGSGQTYTTFYGTVSNLSPGTYYAVPYVQLSDGTYEYGNVITATIKTDESNWVKESDATGNTSK